MVSYSYAMELLGFLKLIISSPEVFCHSKVKECIAREEIRDEKTQRNLKK